MLIIDLFFQLHCHFAHSSQFTYCTQLWPLPQHIYLVKFHKEIENLREFEDLYQAVNFKVMW